MDKGGGDQVAHGAAQDRIVFLTADAMAARAKAIIMAPPPHSPNAVIMDAAQRALRYVDMANRLRMENNVGSDMADPIKPGPA